jgi:hypothetical protein
MRARALHLVAAAAVLLLAAAVPSRGQTPAARDTSLEGFLGGLSDSTDRYFGLSAAPLDTTDLDFVLDDFTGSRRRFTFGITPSFDFNRVDGSTPGLAVAVGEEPSEPEHTSWGDLMGIVARANGPGRVLGGARYANRLWLRGQPLDVRLWAGRRTMPLNRKHEGRLLTAASALLFGSDWSHYLRADGATVSLSHTRGRWRARARYRHLLESPLRTTATWNLARRDPEMPWNLAAAQGRNRELGYLLAMRWPHLPLRTEVEYQTSSRRLGSDFDYRRWRAAAGLDLSLGHFASLVPQLSWGRLTGDAVPQASFYLGADGTLRSLHHDERGGTGCVIAKLDLIGAQDLLETLRIPHPAALPLQGALFVATTAVWGHDPYGGPAVGGQGWPDRQAWLSEVGASVLYISPLLFDRNSALRISYAWPIGPDSRTARWSLSISRALDLLQPAPEED